MDSDVSSRDGLSLDSYLTRHTRLVLKKDLRVHYLESDCFESTELWQWWQRPAGAAARLLMDGMTRWRGAAISTARAATLAE